MRTETRKALTVVALGCHLGLSASEKAGTFCTSPSCTADTHGHVRIGQLQD